MNLASPRNDLAWLLVAFVMVGTLPLLTGIYQYLLVIAHFLRLHYANCGPALPRTAILIPAWNEAAVIEASIDRLMRLDYPREALRIYVVDDASTDDTPLVVQAKAADYPGNVVHLRRESGGEGKAQTLNHGLAEIMSDDWMQALLIMDADVIYERDSLRAMTRHLADQKVGAVTGYIQEGSSPGNYMTRCRLGGIGFGAIWFSVFLLPVLLLLSCASLVTLYFVDPQVSHSAFLVLWIVNVIAYAFITCYSLLIDPQAGRRTWRQGILFPGIISLLIMAQVVITAPVQWLIVHALAAIGLPAGPLVLRGETLFSYLWLSGSMAVAYLAKRVERDSGPGRYLSMLLLYLAGYGSLLCAITLATYVKEI